MPAARHDRRAGDSSKLTYSPCSPWSAPSQTNCMPSVVLPTPALPATSVAVPLARPGFLTAIVLGFAHTIGEFGVVLIIGGNIPGETRVLSIAIYDHVEAVNYAGAHVLAGGLLITSFVMLLAVYGINRRIAFVRP